MDVILNQKINKINISVTDISNYALNTGIGLRNWGVAKAKGYGNVLNTVFIGDSILDSTGATTHDSGFVGLVRNALQFSTGLAGRGFVCNQVINPDGTWTSTLEGTNLITLKATPASTPVSFKDFIKTIEIIFGKRTDGGTNASIKIDGGVAGTINCNGSTSYHNSQTITTVAGVHTVQIIPATDGNTYIEGIVCKSGNNGVVVNQMGHPGIKAYDYLNNDLAISATISAYNPLLTVIMLGTNDSGGQIALADYSQALDQMVKKALTTGDCLVISMANNSVGDGLAIQYSSYVYAAKQIAINNACAYLNLYERWNKSYTWANTNGLMFDGTHPSQAGHVDIANAICEILKIYFPPAGIFQINSDAASPYGDIKMINASGGSLRIPDLLYVGLHSAGINVAVTTGASSIVVSNSLPDSSYAVIAIPNWNTTYWITAKSYAGFTINFGTVAPSGATVDWSLVR